MTMHTIYLTEENLTKLRKKGQLAFTGSGECTRGYNNEYQLELVEDGNCLIYEPPCEE